jgi:hypothetical protein
MFQIKLITLLLSLAAIVIFYLQNQQSIALVVYGISLPLQFSVAIWALLALFAGILTSVVLQILSNLGRSRASEKTRETTPYRSSQTTVKKNSNSQKKSSQKQDKRTLERPRQEEIDWDTPSQKKVDWDGREIISQPNWTREIKDEDIPLRSQSPVEKNNEVERKPIDEDRSGSMYSYSYGESKNEDEREDREKKRKPRNIDRVYDANYRIIDEPTNERSPARSTLDEDEDWI